MGKIDPDDLLTISQAAEHRGVSRQAISELVVRGRLPVQEIAGRQFISRQNLSKLQNRGKHDDCLFSWSCKHPLTDEEYREQLAARFWAKVDKTPGQGPKGECWTWIGHQDKGYGRINVKIDGKFRPVSAQRVAYFLMHGKWPENQGCHECDFPLCVRPDHIWDGTQKENLNDAQRKGRFPIAKPRPAQPERIELTNSQAALLRRRRKEQKFSLAEVGGWIDLSESGYCLVEGRKRSVKKESLQILLDRLGIKVEDF